MTIGDVLAVIAALFACGATWTATVLISALAFPVRAGRAQAKLIASPGACFGRGLLVSIAVVIVSGIVGRGPGPAKILSGALYVGLAVVAALGSAGIARLMGERIRETGAKMSPFASLTRGTILYVAAGYLPVIGWFLIVPVALCLSVGSGVGVLAPVAPVRPREAVAAPSELGVGGLSA